MTRAIWPRPGIPLGANGRRALRRVWCAGAYALTPPGWQGTLPAGVQQISATTKRVYVLTRTLVNSPSDLDAAVAVEASYRNGPLSAYPNGLFAPIFDNLQPDSLAPSLPSYGVALFQQINQAILSYPPLPRNAVQAAELVRVGVDVLHYRQPSASLAAILSGSIQPAVTNAVAYYESAFTVLNGWDVLFGIENITYNPLRRFALAFRGAGTHIEKEADHAHAVSLLGAPVVAGEHVAHGVSPPRFLGEPDGRAAAGEPPVGVLVLAEPHAGDDRDM
jgi:hypothetical protein